MKRMLFAGCVLIFQCFIAASQDSLHAKNDTASFTADSLIGIRLVEPVSHINEKRIRIVAAANLIGYGGSLVSLYSTWYKKYPQTHFHFFNDNKEWLQMDKAGHMYSAYMESRISMALWRSTGVTDKQAAWAGGLSGVAYQTIIETLDGFSAQWGWSWGDIAANVLGSGMLVSQQLAWKEQRVLYKFSFHRKTYGPSELNQRADEIYGTGFLERMLKDYNGQTYWLSANVKSFFPSLNLPAWLNLSMGYGGDDMFGGRVNIWTDKNGLTHDRRDIKRYGQYYLAPDIDLTKIKTKSKVLRTVFFALNSFKFPTPSLEFSHYKFHVNWLHF
ncbi:MAG: hypothetical protein JWN76_178 [Chitinophagaceae bacterium]|nr:hypothetical protein [Chitinophagaceae bacterium]